MPGRELPRCAAHGLAYDPAIHEGCTLCRNSKRPSSTDGAPIAWRDIAMVVLMAMWVGGVISGAYFGVQRFRDLRTRVAAEIAEKAPMPPAPAGADSPWDGIRLETPKELPMIRRPGVDAFGYPRDAVDKLGLLTLLHLGDFSNLTKYVEQLEEAFESDFRKEEWVTQAFECFDTADARVGERIDQWLLQSPDSFAPILARAQHRVALGWYYRGAKFMKDTADDRKQKFKEVLTGAEPDVERAIALRPKAIAAYQLKLWIANALGKDAEKRKIFDAAITICPNCFRIRSKYIVAMQPRWGGSFEGMERIASEAQALAFQNPRLKVLLGYADEERAHTYREQEKFAAAFDAIDRALSIADFPRFHEERAWILRRSRRDKEALEELEKAVDQEPMNDSYLMQRGGLRLEAGKLREGTDDLKVAQLLDPVSEDNRSAVERGVKKLIYEGYQRQLAADKTGAVAAYDMALELSPGNVDALERKARVFTGEGQVEKLEAAALANPTNFDVYKQLDDELVKTREFRRIVAHWDRYIAANPNDGRAYYERGGANYHAGNRDAAIADLDRACAAGVQRGCDGARDVRARTR